MAQFVSIDAEAMSFRFHCPVCGAAMYTKNGEATNDPCDHFLFSWTSMPGEALHTTKELEDLFEDDESWGYPSDESFLSRCPVNAVLFAFETSGMACGPIADAVVHAIKFPAPEQD